MNREVRLFGIAALAIVFGTALLLLIAPTMMNDFVEYWAAGRLNFTGENPYDPVLMLELQRSVGFTGERALMMLPSGEFNTSGDIYRRGSPSWRVAKRKLANRMTKATAIPAAAMPIFAHTKVLNTCGYPSAPNQ